MSPYPVLILSTVGVIGLVCAFKLRKKPLVPLLAIPHTKYDTLETSTNRKDSNEWYITTLFNKYRTGPANPYVMLGNGVNFPAISQY